MRYSVVVAIPPSKKGDGLDNFNVKVIAAGPPSETKRVYKAALHPERHLEGMAMVIYFDTDGSCNKRRLRARAAPPAAVKPAEPPEQEDEAATETVESHAPVAKHKRHAKKK